MVHLMSAEGKALDPAHVRPEYPRPQLVRDSFYSLNGLWEYAVTRHPEEPFTKTGNILVPFPLESLLSGVGKALAANEYLVYRRTFTLPNDFIRKDVILHFEAVDYECAVWLNGEKLLIHRGGYLPFSAMITPFLKAADNVLTVVVKDNSYNEGAAVGKQKIKRGGIWYTPCSGIWQSVWLESVPENYIRDVRITPDFDCKTVSFDIISEQSDGTIDIDIKDQASIHIPYRNGHATTTFETLHPWSPEDPFLYEVKLQNTSDQIASYFAFRKVSLGPSPYGPCILLNDHPYFMNGVLDQGYYSDGNLTAPSEKAIIDDILAMKQLGFNTLRKHIKVEDRRYYYQCDRLGMLVWQDFPSGGCFSFFRMGVLPTLGVRRISDTQYRHFGRQNEINRHEFIEDAWDILKLLNPFPSIVMWVPFNEGWGQFDAKQIAEMVKKTDPTRLVDHASGWFDQGGPDFSSLHIYFKKVVIKPDREHRPVILSEFGGYTLATPGHMFNPDKVFGYKKFADPGAMEEALVKLYEEEIIPAIKNGLCAAIYTQLSDVEDEVNGFLTYDREVLKVSPERIREVMRKVTY